MIAFDGGDGILTATANAGVRIQVPVGGQGRRFTHLCVVSYTPGSTPHTITAMRGVSRDTVVAAMAAGDVLLTSRVMLKDGDGNDLAANDVLAIELDDFSWHLSTVASLDTPKTGITITTAIPTGRSVRRFANVVAYGVAGDAFHAEHRRLTLAGQENVIGNGSSFCRALWQREPLIIDSDNSGVAGVLNYANVGFTVE